MTQVFRNSKPFMLSLCLSISALSACASRVKTFDYPVTTNSSEEIQRLDQEMTAAGKRQAHVLSPDHFAKAREKLDDAKRGKQRGESNVDVLEDLGHARAHLDMANAVTAKAEQTIPEVVRARSDAIAAEAYRIRTEALSDADRELAKTTSDFEDGDYDVSIEKKNELQKRYQNVELAAIKGAHLDESRALIDAAKEMDAKKLASQTLTSAETKYQNAERVIETDRHDTRKINAASDAARLEANRLIRVTRLAKNAKEGTPEAVALELEARQTLAEQNRREAERKQSQLSRTQSELRSKTEVLGSVTEENKKLEQDVRFNEAFKTAQAAFSKDEADVYRQGDNLIIRLKALEFKSGRADVPENSLSTLSKVKDVIESMDAENVVVEGHTDAVGSRAVNTKLSESRAKTIANYLVSTNAVSDDQIETKGYGFDKPITSNRTTAGRAQNRRVDLVITPPKLETASEMTTEE